MPGHNSCGPVHQLRATPYADEPATRLLWTNQAVQPQSLSLLKFSKRDAATILTDWASDRVTGIGGQANSGEPREVRLEVLADHITDVHGVMSEREGGER